MKLLYSLAIMGCAFCLAGCGPDLSHLPATVTAEGTVTLDGAPVEGATVSFIAEQGNYHATATTDASGHFSLDAFKEKPGAVPGSYRVEINKTLVEAIGSGGGGDEGGIGETNVQFGLPKKYAAMATSGLSHTIPEQGDSAITFELKSK
ncbi:carboxypeptidase-like regulatory domain-containing protein [Aureliella helgolandensis]|uniref:Nickel uptake substrate-specific transmembrane region n=1 Tax=Aureliella helgolandensis TaxID=2527968 RepID=A0A518GF75_9BACT|nr:carboxypeptidase-like regulatory domain-containing protein [Aureliella helgolandensis]QDV27252.1 Nickel uptake substrate-specific transmembrane region [Aureliella helgolandensis]